MTRAGLVPGSTAAVAREEIEARHVPVVLDYISHNDMVEESWEHWIDSRRESPSEVTEEAPALWRNTISVLRRELSWAVREIDNLHNEAEMTVRRARGVGPF